MRRGRLSLWHLCFVVSGIEEADVAQLQVKFTEFCTGRAAETPSHSRAPGEGYMIPLTLTICRFASNEALPSLMQD